MHGAALLVTAFTLVACASEAPPGPLPWGADGHEMAARAAAAGLSSEIPAFFRDAAPQLIYLNPEPDRWRESALAEMDQAWSYDHYVDLENIPAGGLNEENRFTFIRLLYRSGIERPERDAGFLPFRIVELYQRLVTEWRLWRHESDPEKRQWIEERIVADAGILGHYVTDAANPHHSTIHFNGWNSDAPNPEGYTYDRDFHYRFENQFVRAHVDDEHVQAHVRGSSESVAGDARSAVMEHIQESNDHVEELYRLERDVGFDPDRPAAAETLAFAAERIAAGADMLRTLWWSAWLESATNP